MVPEGHESRFFGLWAFVDKGSSWIGPAVVSVILQTTGTFRLAFAFPLAILVPPVFMLAAIDYEKGARDAKAFGEAWAAERRERAQEAGGGGGGGGGSDGSAPLALRESE